MNTLTCLFNLALSFAASADEPSFKDTLSEALYVESVARDLDAAAEGYARIVDSIRENAPPAEQRDHAAALFRLAEVRDQEGRNEEAEKLYREFLDRFPDQKHQLTLARKKLGSSGPALRQKLAELGEDVRGKQEEGPSRVAWERPPELRLRIRP